MRESMRSFSVARLLVIVMLALPLLPPAAIAQIDAARAAFEKEDYAGAYRLFRPIAEQGGAEAQYRIGLMHKFGWGTERDHAVAAKWLRLAAEQSHPQAQAELGVYYKDGRGVARDLTQAAGWFRKAAEQGVGIAQLNLGRAYKDGQGVAKDPIEAYVWFTLASRNGYMDGLSHRATVAESMDSNQIADAESRVKARAGSKSK